MERANNRAQQKKPSNILESFQNVECRIVLYNAFIFSRLNYGDELYVNSYPKSHLDKLKVTQNKILKILPFKRKSLRAVSAIP